MSDKEILIAKLTAFLHKYGAYDYYIAGLAKCGSYGNTIDQLAEWCINNNVEDEIIRMSFHWLSVERDTTYTWGELHLDFQENYKSLPYEIIVDNTWDNMWER